MIEYVGQMGLITLTSASLIYSLLRIFNTYGFTDFIDSTNIYKSNIYDAFPDPTQPGFKANFKLPAISIYHLMTLPDEPLQLGGGRWVKRVYNIDVFARNGSERDEVSEFIRDNFTSIAIPLYDFNPVRSDPLDPSSPLINKMPYLGTKNTPTSSVNPNFDDEAQRLGKIRIEPIVITITPYNLIAGVNSFHAALGLNVNIMRDSS